MELESTVQVCAWGFKVGRPVYRAPIPRRAERLKRQGSCVQQVGGGTGREENMAYNTRYVIQVPPKLLLSAANAPLTRARPILGSGHSARSSSRRDARWEPKVSARRPKPTRAGATRWPATSGPRARGEEARGGEPTRCIAGACWRRECEWACDSGYAISRARCSC